MMAITQNYIYVDWGTAFANFHAKRFGESVVVGLQVNMASIAVEVLVSVIWRGLFAFQPNFVE